MNASAMSWKMAESVVGEYNVLCSVPLYQLGTRASACCLVSVLLAGFLWPRCALSWQQYHHREVLAKNLTSNGTSLMTPDCVSLVLEVEDLRIPTTSQDSKAMINRSTRPDVKILPFILQQILGMPTHATADREQ